MYDAEDLSNLAFFAFSECERFLDGSTATLGDGLHPLSDDEARLRLKKADGGEMNGISWTVGHMAWQWTRLATRAVYARDFPSRDRAFGHLPQSDDEPFADLRRRVYRFRTGTEIPPDPPSLQEARELLRESKAATEAWLPAADAALLASTVNARDAAATIASEPIGKNVVRAVLHTFTHSGEVLAIRQMLGHPEIGFMQMKDLPWPGEQPGPVEPSSLVAPRQAATGR